jgi:peroxiredoxin
MARTLSTMLSLGTQAPGFCLEDVDGKLVQLEDFKRSKALLVVFMCNHCPFVQHVLDGLIDLVRHYEGTGIGVVGINSNDVEAYPADHPDMMAQLAMDKAFPFPYLYDPSQEVAKAYQAACTPDFFLFDKDHRLVYRGQMDDSRPGNGVPVTGRDLRAAIDAVLAGQPVPTDQRPSMGCNIKWRPGR